MRGKNLILKQKLESIKVQDIAVCSIVKSELFYGALKSAKPERNLAAQQEFLAQFISLPFDDSATMIFGTIRTRLEALRTPIGSYDLQIASIAINYNLTLATHNTREFKRVNDLQLEDWEIE